MYITKNIIIRDIANPIEFDASISFNVTCYGYEAFEQFNIICDRNNIRQLDRSAEEKYYLLDYITEGRVGDCIEPLDPERGVVYEINCRCFTNDWERFMGKMDKKKKIDAILSDEYERKI